MNNEANNEANNEVSTTTTNAGRSLLYGRNLRKIAQLALRGMPTTARNLRDRLAAGERVDWREYESAIRATRRWPSGDSLDLPLAMRAPSPSRLIVSQSLRDTLFSMARSGNAVASKLALALDYRHHHKPSLFANFFTFRERAGMISFCPSNRVQEINEDGTWARKNRQEISPAKWARRVLCDRLNAEFSDAAISEFAAAFSARERAAEVRIEVVTLADEINHGITEVGVRACMEGENVGPWYQSQECSLVKVVNGNEETIARAILWPRVRVQGVEKKVPMLERIYARANEPINRAALEETLKNYARSIGAFWKVRQSNDCDEVTNDGQTVYRALYAVTSESPFGRDFYPYLDTFCYATRERLFASSDEACRWLSDGDEVELLRSTSGCSATMWVYDGHLSDTDRSDMVQDVDGEWINQEDAVFCEDDSEYYHNDDCRVVHCDSTNDYRLRENCRSVHIGRTTYIVHEDDIGNA